MRSKEEIIEKIERIQTELDGGVYGEYIAEMEGQIAILKWVME